MSDLKTQPTQQSAQEFLKTIEPEDKRRDSFAILEMMERITGEKPVMWGSSIIGFGKYHYKSERSRQEGDWMLTGFSPRKQNITFYIISGFKDNRGLLKKLGKCKTSVGCLYINKLADVDMTILEKLIDQSYRQMKKLHG